MFKHLFFCALLSFTGICSASPAATLLLPSSPRGWQFPCYDPNGRDIVLTTGDLGEIRLFVRGEDSTRLIARGEKIGRRFVFEPGRERIVFRTRINALPERPERLISTSVFIYDPVHRTGNDSGTVYGPYLASGRVLYRRSPLEPFVDYEGKEHLAGPYLDPSTGQLSVKDKRGGRAYLSTPHERVAGAEILPDGKWVAAVAEILPDSHSVRELPSGPSVRLSLISVETGTIVTAGEGFAPSWAGDSQSLVCVRRDDEGRAELQLVAVPSGKARVILNDERFEPETPALNSDGTRALFISRGALYEIEIGP